MEIVDENENKNKNKERKHTSGSPQTARSSWSHVNNAIDRWGTSAWIPQQMASDACLNSDNLNSNANSHHFPAVS